MLNPDQFRRIAAHWLSGVSVVTTVDEAGEPCGMTVSATSSLSLNPPQFLVCLDAGSRTLAAIRASGFFCINFLAEHQQEVSSVFARRGEHNRFAGVEYHLGASGAPVLHGVVASVECGLHEVMHGGDHGIVIGNALFGEVHDGHPLGYFAGAYRRIDW